jgi:hypothetical protein
MGAAKLRTEGPGGEVELWRSATDIQSDAAGRDTGSTAARNMIVCILSPISISQF